MHGIGYRQFVAVAHGHMTPAEALGLMQRETVRYARRQMTWFAREPGITWIDVAAAGRAGDVAAQIEARLAREGVIE
jgi:tRNA dimethylallyltransferase